MSKTFCNLPWTRLYVATSGHQKICCHNDEHITKDDGYHQFNMQRDMVNDSWNSNYMKEMRLALMNGKRVSQCKKCYIQEDDGHSSMRSTVDMDILLAQTNADGSVNIPPKSLELHFGNVCNLHCKMCSHDFSHMIGKELLKMGDADPEFLQWVKKESGTVNNWTGELDIIYDWFKNEKIKKSIFAHVSDNVSDLNIIGGEPTIIKEFYELLEFCYKANTLKDKSVLIHSNMTNTNKNISSWLGSMKQWAITASIDAVGIRNHYIRYPANWNSIKNSIQFYKDIGKKYDNGAISYNPAIQVLNIDQLIELCLFFEENLYETRASEFYSHVKYPLICNYDILPSDYKKTVADDLEKNLNKLTMQTYVKEIRGHIATLRQEVFSDQEKKMYQKMFVKYNDAQDKFRKHTPTWRKLLPNLESSLLHT